MTIVEAIKKVLENSAEGMTTQNIYDEIIANQLYSFGAKNPVGVVNSQLRRRCKDLDFPTAYPVKLFEISGYAGKKPLFPLLSQQEKPNKDPKAPKNVERAELLPEERLGIALAEHIESVKQQVFDSVVHNTPAFFEHLVMDLLLAMGYGTDKTSGVVTGRSHDGGIDGIISEDKLGLDLIYIQAKRYDPANRVGRKELQAFIGAMEHVRKGVFITTSSFTKEAISFIEKQQQKSIKLIDGTLLADLLVKYRVGVNVAQTFSLYKLDVDYFVE